VSRACINNVINVRVRVVFFGISFMKIPIISTDTDGILFLVNRDRIGYPLGIGNGIYESCILNFVILYFNSRGFGRVDGSLFLMNRVYMWPSINAMLDDGRI